MKSVVWITDVPGWAYDNRATNLALCLPGYNHRVVCYPRGGFVGCVDADIIVCPDPRVLEFLPAGPQIVLNLNAIKLFRGNE